MTGGFRERADELAAEITVNEGGSPYREGGGDLLDQSARLLELGRCQWQLARLDDAERSLGRALELRERLLPARDPLVTDARERMAALRHYQLRDARGWFDDVVAARIAAHGRDHLATAIALRNQGAYLRDLGVRGAASRLDEAERRIAQLLGDDHPEHAAALKAQACLALHAPPPAWDALALAERAFEVTRNAHPDDHPFVGAAILLVARGQAKAGEHAARRSFADARANLEAAYGDAHPLLAFVEAGLAGIARRDDALDVAITHGRAAIAIYERTYARSPFVARTRWKLAEALMEAQEPDLALAELEAGVAALSAPRGDWPWGSWVLALAEVANRLGYVQIAHRASVHASAFES